jgi:hypothetical protein
MDWRQLPRRRAQLEDGKIPISEDSDSLAVNGFTRSRQADASKLKQLKDFGHGWRKDGGGFAISADR